MDWKIVRSEYLFNDLWFTVRKDVCERPDGKIINPYYVYEFPTWVAAVAITKDGKYIMVRQYRHALGLTMYEIPGGCVDADDKSIEEAVARELKEETGYEFGKYSYLGKISANPSTNNNWLHMYLATEGVKVSEQHLDDNEDLEVELFSLEDLKMLLMENRIIQSMHATALFYALIKTGDLSFHS
ncbi:MAG: NUDIX hydrolase [Chitinophagaceae bacterium]